MAGRTGVRGIARRLTPARAASAATRWVSRIAAWWLLALPGAAALYAQAASQSDGLDAALQRALRPLVARVPANSQLGLVIADAASNETLFVHQGDTLLKPASVLKIFVAAAALEHFGPEFEYRTDVYLHERQLWVRGGGDPGLGDGRIARKYDRNLNHHFDEWAAALRAAGVTELERVVLDDSIFDEEWTNAAWPVSQADRWYQAPVGGLNLNDNCLDVVVVVRNGQVEVQLQPDLPATLLRNELTAGGKHGPTIRRAADSDVFELRGAVTQRGELRAVAVRQPTIFFAHALKQALETRGIRVTGPVTRRTLTAAECAAARPLASNRTHLRDVLWRVNTFSQNMFAEALLKSLSAYAPDGRRTGTPGSWSGGERELRALLGRIRLNVDSAVFVDGSGLSHTNRVTAGQIVELLVRMHSHRYANAFRESLARAGEVGSMRTRYRDPALVGRMIGKTGSLSGVATVAGYLTRDDGRVLAFAALINGPAPDDLLRNIARAIVTASP